MREIKFRLWHDSAKLMLFVGDDHGTSHPLDCCKYYMEGQGSHLMQYTGLKDKNGVEIYEGDVIASSNPYGIEPERILGVVMFNTNNYANLSAFHLCDKDGKSMEFYGQNCQEYQGEKTQVIGNIYENAELVDRIGYR